MRSLPPSITVGARPIEDFPTRRAQGRNRRALAAEERDWNLVRPLLRRGERLRARVAVKFTEQRNAAGHAFLTDQRIMFEFHEKVQSFALVHLSYIGRPPRTGGPNFLVDAIVPDGPGAGRFSMPMRVRDTAAFHDFFPTLLDAARAVGAQPEFDDAWDVTEPPAGREPEPREDLQSADDRPTDDAVVNALTSLLRPVESVVCDVSMVRNFGTDTVRVIVTDQRLLVVDGSLVWAALLSEIKLIDIGGVRTHLRMLVGELDDWRVLGVHRVAVDPAEERRIVLRAAADKQGYERLHDHLAGVAGEVIPAWPQHPDGAGTDRNPVHSGP